MGTSCSSRHSGHVAPSHKSEATKYGVKQLSCMCNMKSVEFQRLPYS